ncbi:hypothetical protein ElyMa_004094500 [Elysia marginata]|uniref:Uncharacterized protein n=1 Tax=Elysia marginata TaxID=1093978 RepID=A0AAV4GC98_9GAST|nr:hypothetical protein ElyMa_004094500 [Elysia marginata]
MEELQVYTSDTRGELPAAHSPAAGSPPLRPATTTDYHRQVRSLDHDDLGWTWRQNTCYQTQLDNGSDRGLP